MEENTNNLVSPVENMDGIMGDAMDMNEEQAQAIQTLAEAKAERKLTPEQLYWFRNRTPLVREYKIRRNDPCPCGSGKKYKNCCLNSGKYEQLVKSK